MFKRILIGFDPRGEEKVSAIKAYLAEKNVVAEVCDCAGLDYVDATKKSCEMFEKTPNFDGIILICGTGVGVTMVSNRFSFVRAVLGSSFDVVYFARRHENCNCLCLQAGYDDGKHKIEISKKELFKCVDAFLDTDFEGGRHAERVNKLLTLGE